LTFFARFSLQSQPDMTTIWLSNHGRFLATCARLRYDEDITCHIETIYSFPA